MREPHPFCGLIPLGEGLELEASAPQFSLAVSGKVCHLLGGAGVDMGQGGREHLSFFLLSEKDSGTHTVRPVFSNPTHPGPLSGNSPPSSSRDSRRAWLCLMATTLLGFPLRA